jgi:hypothetical protein
LLGDPLPCPRRMLRLVDLAVVVVLGLIAAGFYLLLIR